MTTTTAVRVTVVPDAIALGPGEAADLEITVQNASEVVGASALVGLPSDVFAREPATPLMLRPRESGTVRGRIAIPAQAGPVAGRYMLRGSW